MSANEGSSHAAGIMVVELGIRGHQGYYMKYLVRHWCLAHDYPDLNVVVRPEFLDMYPDVTTLAEGAAGSNVRFLPISREEERGIDLGGCPILRIAERSASFRSHFGLRLRRHRAWMLFKEYADRLSASHCLLMDIDSYVVPLAFDHDLRTTVSGILFKPMFHYASLPATRLRPRDRFAAMTQRYLLKRVIMKPQLQNFFCLDPFAVDRINALSTQKKAVVLPEPVRILENPVSNQALRQELGIGEERRVALLLGTIAPRRGIFELLDSLLLLPQEVCERLCILLAGPVAEKHRAAIQAKIELATTTLPLQVVTNWGIIGEADLPRYYHAADFALVLNPRHVGSSGCLLQAAGAQKPVIATSFGLVGELVRTRQLGLAVGTTNVAELATALCTLTMEPSQSCFSPELALAFAQENTPERFALTLAEALLSPGARNSGPVSV